MVENMHNDSLIAQRIKEKRVVLNDLEKEFENLKKEKRKLMCK